MPDRRSYGLTNEIELYHWRKPSQEFWILRRRQNAIARKFIENFRNHRRFTPVCLRFLENKTDSTTCHVSICIRLTNLLLFSGNQCHYNVFVEDFSHIITRNNRRFRIKDVSVSRKTARSGYFSSDFFSSLGWRQSLKTRPTYYVLAVQSAKMYSKKVSVDASKYEIVRQRFFDYYFFIIDFWYTSGLFFIVMGNYRRIGI